MKYFASLIFALLAISCNDPDPALPGSMGAISSAVIVDCNPNGLPETCLVATNAIEQKIMAFSLTSNLFIKSPTQISPLIVQAGSLTTQLAVPSQDSNWVMALDPSENKVYAIAASNPNDARLVFVTPPAGFEVAPNIDKFAAFQDSSSDAIFWLIMTSSKDKMIYLYPVDKATGEKSNKSKIITAALGKVVDKLIVSGLSRVVGIIDMNGKFSWNSFENLLGTSWWPGGHPSSFTTVASDTKYSDAVFSLKAEKQVLLIGKNKPLVDLFDLNAPAEAIRTFEMTKFPVSAYFPLAGETCCDGSEEWLSVLDAKGVLHYLTFDNLTKDKSNQDRFEENSNTLFAYETLDVGLALSRYSMATLSKGIFHANVIQKEIDGKVSQPQSKMIYVFGTGLIASSDVGLPLLKRLQPN